MLGHIATAPLGWYRTHSSTKLVVLLRLELPEGLADKIDALDDVSGWRVVRALVSDAINHPEDYEVSPRT